MIRVPYLETNPTSTKWDRRRHKITFRLTVALLGAVLLIMLIAPAAYAVPMRIIILRHGEKQDNYALCPVGQQRSLALCARYLGKGAAKSLFPGGDTPAAIFATTLHCLELINPVAQSYDLPIQLYSVVPINGQTAWEETVQLNQRTQEAAKSLLTDPRWDRKTVVVVWEHDHIAKASLEKQFPGEKVTLRQLLNLDTLPNVPEDWYGGNYDYFWIVDYARPHSTKPTNFSLMKQNFPLPYDIVPNNEWGTDEDLPDGSGCEP
jgi:hypothetical protein